MSHHHHHHHPETGSSYNSVSFRLITTMILNFIITAAEIAGGILSGSLSLISDALHNFSDGISVIISFIAIKLKSKERSHKHTFGLKRAEILAAVINSAVLIIISVYLFYEAVKRLYAPEEISAKIMIIVAVIGLIANIAGTLLLKRDAAHSLNIKSSYLHLLSDTVMSVAVIIGGLAIMYWNIYWIDPLLTIFIGVYILRESYFILAEAIHVLMEGAPEIHIDNINEEVIKFRGVRNLHHLHIWSVGENDVYLEAHIDVDDMLVSKCDILRLEIEQMLNSKFNINHITLQFECNVCQDTNLIKQAENHKH